MALRSISGIGCGSQLGPTFCLSLLRFSTTHGTQAEEPVTISIRANAAQRDWIDQAADRLGRSRSDFMLEAASKLAEAVMLDQTYFALDAQSFAAHQAMLDKPLADA